MTPGKLPAALLAELVAQCSTSPDVLVGAEVGEDAAVVRGKRRLVVTADPITFTDQDIGTYVASVNANDIVAMGGRPRYLTTTILLPPGTTVDRVREIFAGIGEATRNLDLLWIGGHTEVTDAVTRVVVSGHAIGVLERRPTTTSGARAGDYLVLTKWAGLEGTTLIAREKPDLVRKLLGESGYRDVLGWLRDPGISIVQEGRIALTLDIHAAHDPTEGGVATSVRELAARSGLGVLLRRSAVPVREETRVVCEALGVDPLGLLSSGCYLFAAAPVVAERASARLRRRGIPAQVIGVLGPPGGAALMEDTTGRHPLPVFEQDEILKALRT